MLLASIPVCYVKADWAQLFFSSVVAFLHTLVRRSRLVKNVYCTTSLPLRIESDNSLSAGQPAAIVSLAQDHLLGTGEK